MKSLRFLAPLLIFVVVAVFLALGLKLDPREVPSPLIDKSAPEFELPRLLQMEGVVGTAEMRGEVWLLNVWASWCVPCRVEMPLLNELAEDGIVPIYGINFKDDAVEALAFLEELGDPYTRIGADQSGRVAIDWGVYGLPETFVVDADGRIAYKHVGPFDRTSLEEDILSVVRRLQAEDGS